MTARLAPKSSKTRAILVGATALMLVFASACSSGTSTESDSVSTTPETTKSLDAELTGQLDAAIDAAVKQALIPGAIVKVSGPEGTYSHSVGVADKATNAPMEMDFHGRIGSVTKTFVTTGILQLVGDGKLGLDDPISKYIDGVPEGDKVTLRLLAEMRSGLPDYSTNRDWQEAFFGDTSRQFTPQELLDYSWTQPMQFPPGIAFKYTNANLILLGLVLENESGQKIQDYIKEHILEPLKMENTVFPTDAAFPEPHAQGYTVQDLTGDEETATDWNPSWGWAAGAMISTLDDLQIWAPALGKGTLLKPEVQEERLKFLAANGLEPPDGYGLSIFSTGGWIGHNGSLPGYETVVMYLPEKELSLTVMINTDEIWEGNEPSTVVAEAITKVLTPDNVYFLPPKTIGS